VCLAYDRVMLWCQIKGCSGSQPERAAKDKNKNSNLFLVGCSYPFANRIRCHCIFALH